MPRVLRAPRPRVVALTVGLALAASAAGVAVAGGTSVPAQALAGYLSSHPSAAAAPAAAKLAAPTPRATCGPGSLPETGRQGRAPLADYSNGRAAKGYTCNAVQVGHTGTTGGFKTFRYTDRAGRVCAFYDGTLLFPTAVFHQEAGGVHVLDMSDPARPVETARLLTPAMQTPHESLVLNAQRGLLAAGAGNAATAPGVVDVYDVSQDCRQPVLKSSTPLGILGHESGFSPDGRTLWISTTARAGVAAIDVSNPSLPSIVAYDSTHTFHGMSFSADGNRLYGADLGTKRGLTILDVSQVQRRVASPAITEVSNLTWPEVSIPQNTSAFTAKGHKYLLEFDEYSRNPGTYAAADAVGAARIINVDNDRKPYVVSNLRLEVNQKDARATDQQNDPGAQYGVQGYAAHYCAIPRAKDPGIVACSFIASGLRVFDISDPLHPRETAYFNKPAPNALPLTSGAYAMSAPSFDLANKQVWFADGDSGFYTVRLTNGAWPKSLR